MIWTGKRRLAVVSGTAAILSVGIFLVAPGGSGTPHAAGRTGGLPAGPTTTVAELPSSTVTTAETVPPTTEAPKPVIDPDVLGLQQRLAALGYDVGTPDGVFGSRTAHTVMAFQKVEGLKRTGEDNAAVRAALAKATPPSALVPNGEANRVEVDIDRQVLLLWNGGRLARILSVSTGSGQRYCVDSECDVAVTPTGTFRVGRKFSGVEVSRLGELWSPSYFYGGIAMHGSPSVPGYPASHGCVRIPMYAAASLFDQTPAGMAVYVVGSGPSAKVVAPPPDEPTRPATPPPTDPEPTPITTVPATTTTAPKTTTSTTVAP